MTITIAPTLYDHVGDYTVNAVFTSPLSSTKTSLFDIEVVDPCTFDNANMVVSHVFTPALAAYAIADPAVTYSLVFSDTISTHFDVPYTCGRWTIASLTEDADPTSTTFTTDMITL